MDGWTHVRPLILGRAHPRDARAFAGRALGTGEDRAARIRARVLRSSGQPRFVRWWEGLLLHCVRPAAARRSGCSEGRSLGKDAGAAGPDRMNIDGAHLLTERLRLEIGRAWP